MKKIALIALTAIGCGVGSVALAADDSNKQDMLAANEIMELFPSNYKAEVSGYDMLITGSTNGDLRGRAFKPPGSRQVVGSGRYALCVLVQLDRWQTHVRGNHARW